MHVMMAVAYQAATSAGQVQGQPAWWQSGAIALAASIFTAAWGVLAERRRRTIETRHLGLAIGAEISAIRKIVAEELEQDLPDAFREETIRYGEADKEAAPITRAAAPKAGQFPRDVAEPLAEFLTRLGHLWQQTKIVREMHNDDALSVDKLRERHASMRPFAHELIQTGLRLEAAVEQHYGRHR